jgi:hypothetical protein
MWHAARHRNGNLLMDSEWKVIRQSAISIIRAHLLSIDTSGFAAVGRPRKKTFYRHFFSDEWTQAVMELEHVAPLLSLCAGTWKAELTLGSVLHDSHPPDLPSPAPTNMTPPHSTPSSSLPFCPSFVFCFSFFPAAYSLQPRRSFSCPSLTSLCLLQIITGSRADSTTCTLWSSAATTRAPANEQGF